MLGAVTSLPYRSRATPATAGRQRPEGPPCGL